MVDAEVVESRRGRGDCTEQGLGRVRSRVLQAPSPARTRSWLRGMRLILGRVRREPVAAVFRGSERLPLALRGPLLKALGLLLAAMDQLGLARTRLRALHAAALACQGHHAGAAAIIAAGLRTDPDAWSRGQLAHVALRMQRDDLAEAALEGLQARSAATAHAKAGVLFRTGRLEVAEEVLIELCAEGLASRRTLDQLKHIQGKQAVLRRQWSWDPPPKETISPVPGRILHVLTNSLPYKHAGYTIRAQAVGVAQRQVGLDPHFVTRAGFPQLQGVATGPAREQVSDIPYYRLALDSHGTPPEDRVLAATAEGLVDLARELRPACLQPASHHFNAQAALAARKVTGIPVIYEVRGFLEETWRSYFAGQVKDRDYYCLSRSAETACMEAADHVVTLAAVMRDEIVGRGVPRERVTVVPNAVNERIFVPGPPDSGLRDRLGIPQDAVVIGYVGSLVAYEGLDTLVGTVARLRQRGRNVHLLIVGDGDQRSSLVGHASSLGIARHVSLPGRVPHDAVVEHYRLIDVFVVPRRDQQVCRLVTPIKPLEAMACGIPLVTSALPALTELTAKDHAGRSFWPVEEAALADRLEELIADPEQRKVLGEAARERVLAHYTWRANGLRYRALAESLGLV